VAEIAFNEERHEYHVDGVRWPSVTQILDPLLELDGIPRDALEAAARFGSHVHMATDLYDKRQLDEEALDPHLLPYLLGWKKFLWQAEVEVIESELRVAHSSLKYAGTLDKIVRWRGSAHVLDVKTSAEVPWTVGMQTAAYRHALDRYDTFLEVGERLSTVRLCVHLKPDGVYRLIKLSDSRDLNNFISCLNVHNLRMNRGR